MNKLLTLGWVCVVTAGVLWHQRSSLAVVRAEVRRLRAEAEVVAGSIEQAQKAGARLAGELAEEQAKAKGLRQDLAEWDARAEAAMELPRSLGPGQCWPADEPWCYLAKATLTRLGYLTFNIDGRLTDEAALLFGLSRAERARLEDAYAALSQEVQAMDLAHLRPVGTPAVVQRGFSEHRAQSYALEVSPEHTAALQAQFEAAIREVLAGERGDFFLQANRRDLDKWFKELNAAPLRITLLTHKEETPKDRNDAVEVEFRVEDPDHERHCDGELFYPDDKTALGFQRFTTLVRKYEEQSGR